MHGLSLAYNGKRLCEVALMRKVFSATILQNHLLYEVFIFLAVADTQIENL